MASIREEIGIGVVMSVLKTITNNLESPTLQIGLECINKADSAEDAIRKFPIHSGEIALAAMALLLTDDAAQNEIFEYVSNLILVHDELY